MDPWTTRSTSATIAPNILRYLVGCADGRGVDLRPTLVRVGIDEHLLREPSLRVSYRQGSEVIRQAVELTGDEHLGLWVGRSQHLTAWGLVGFALLSADDLRHAIDTGVRFQNLSGAMTVWSSEDTRDSLVLRTDLPDPAADPQVGRFLLEEAFASVVTLARLALTPDFAPRRLDLALPPPPDPGAVHAALGCPVRFDQPASALVIDRSWARTPMPGRDPVTFASVCGMLEHLISERRAQQDLLESLEISVARDLPDVPAFAEQARRRAVSERTLRRRLAECGVTYAAVVDGVRRERVERLLRTRATLHDIARQVGFADERVLRRAVHRWHGVSPGRLRC